MAHRQQLCHHFQRGSCRFGDACNYKHDKSSKRLCHAFAEGRCYRGDRCMYSHENIELQSQGTKPDHRARHLSTGSSTYDQFVQWRYDIKREKREVARAQPLGRRLSSFIQQALTLIDSVETMQEVITTLSSEGGLARIGELLNANLGTLTDDTLLVVFNDNLLPFLRLWRETSYR
jgi:hypothetical protein